MASDIMAKAAIATNDADLQTQLGLKAFLQAVPRNIGRELRHRHFDSVKEALAEARFLQFMEEDEDRNSGKIFMVEAEAKPPVEKPKVDIQQIVEACMKKMQAQQPKKEQSERLRSSRRKLRCWCCSKMRHLMRACPVVQQSKAAFGRQKAEQRRVPDGANGCQMMQKGTRGCQMVPESARGYHRVPDGASGYQMMQKDARGCQMVPEGARGCQMVPLGTR